MGKKAILEVGNKENSKEEKRVGKKIKLSNCYIIC